MHIRRKFAAGLVLVGSGLICGGASAYAAGGGYGPVPPASGAPGGFGSVVSSEVVGPAGGTLTTSSGGVGVNVDVPAGALGAEDNLVVTQGDTATTTPALAGLGYGNYTAVVDFGINLLDAHGAKLTGTFSHPITVTLTGAGLGSPGEQVIELTGPTSAQAVPFTLGTNSVTITITSDPDLAVLAANSSSSGTNATANSGTGTGTGGTIRGATTQHTGKPFFAEELGAGILVIIGAASIGRSRRRRQA